MPGDVHLLFRDAKGVIQDMPMGQSLSDPVFAGRVEAVTQETTYAVKYGDEQTRWYKVGVFEFPGLKQADADLHFPEFTGLPDKTIKDTRSVTAVEGTKATLEFHLNKAVATATLVPEIHASCDATGRGRAPCTKCARRARRSCTGWGTGRARWSWRGGCACV